MDIQTKDGILLRGIPDGTPDDVIKARILDIRAKSNISNSASKETPSQSFGKNMRDMAWAAAHHVTNIPFELGQVFSNAASEGASLVAPESDVAKNLKDRAQSYRDFMSEREQGYQASVPDSPYATIGAVAGELAPYMLKPVQAGLTAIGGAAKSPIAKVIQALTSSPKLAKYAGNIGSGAAQGTTAAALSPVANQEGTYGENKSNQIGTGLGIGAGMAAVIPPVAWAAGKTGKVINNIVGPFREKWRNEQATKYLSEQLGDGKQKIVDAITKFRDTNVVPSPNVNIGPTTVSDRIAAANVGKTDKFGTQLVKAEEMLSGQGGGISDVAKSIVAKQEAAKAAEIGNISGNEEKAKIVQQGIDKASEAYNKIKPTIVNSDDTLNALSSSPAFQKAESVAEEISKNTNATARANNQGIIPFKSTVDKVDENGNPIKLVQYSAQGLQHIKQVLDEMTQSQSIRDTLGVSGTESANIAPLKGTLVEWMNKNISGWQSAREGYAVAMQPKNRMAVGQELTKSLTSATGKEKANTFATAMQEAPRTIKRATGSPRYDTLEEVLTPSEMSSVDKVKKAILRDVEKESLATGVDVKNLFDIAEKGKGSFTIPHMLSRPATIGNWLMGKIGNTADDMIAKDMGELMLKDPEAFARKYLSELPPSAREKFFNHKVTKAMIRSSAPLTTRAVLENSKENQ